MSYDNWNLLFYLYNLFSMFPISDVSYLVIIIYSLLINNLTTIEYREKINKVYDQSPYFISKWHSFHQVFGKNPLYWLIPISNF